MTSHPTRSGQLYERALRVLPGGVSRNTVLRRPHPFYAASGQGCHVTDIEGVRRIKVVPRFTGKRDGLRVFANC